MNEDGWGWMRMGEDGWGRMRMDENRWGIGLKWMRMDEDGWGWLRNEDEDWWEDNKYTWISEIQRSIKSPDNLSLNSWIKVWTKFNYKGIESLSQTLISNPYIFATQCRRPIYIFQTMNSVGSNDLSFKYQRLALSGCIIDLILFF